MAYGVYSIVAAFMLLFHCVAAAQERVYLLYNRLYNGTVTAETVSGTGSLDGLKLSSTANETSYEWWYFDAVSTSSQNESFNLVFYNAGSEGFPRGYKNGPLSVELSGTFQNGTLFSYTLPVSNQAVFTEDEDGVAGDWKGTGAKFVGSTLSRPEIVYHATVHNPDIDVSGKIEIRSVAPPRYNCGPDVPGTSELAFLNVGWANAIPDGNATVDFNISGSPLQFTGLGYHDQNWGLSPFTNDVNHTYWGHARVGPYSVVFSDVQSPGAGSQSEETFSATVVKDGQFVELSCAEDAVVVRPWGGDDEYPPKTGSPPPLGVGITFQLSEGNILRLNVTNDLIIDNQDYYQRFIGSVEGTFNNGEVIEGRALYEQFKMISA